ncbi:MAG: DUF2284 domain-containing protein [Dehalococcoidia bacterium]|jgi:predicted metal-binding protein|nr:DUF2284 domain-containing protein [Dehalococcoidia bacterium]
MEQQRHTVKPITTGVTQEQVRAAAEGYCQMAVSLGASEALAVPREAVIVDERVRLKCFIPRCPRMGETPNCPPHTPEPDHVRKALDKYSWAVLLKTDIKSVADYMPLRGASATHRKKALSYHAETGRIVTEIEDQAFRDGFYLALGLGGGSCKDHLCQGQVCQFLDSGCCRFPLKARPSMEGLGIDVFGMVSRVGWSIYPVASHESEPDSIPCGVSVGLVFIQ